MSQLRRKVRNAIIATAVVLAIAAISSPVALAVAVCVGVWLAV